MSEIDLSKVPDGKLHEALGVDDPHADDWPDEVVDKLTAEQKAAILAESTFEEG